MTDRHAMLAAIKAAPDDDTPRLVYADWLGDRGEHDRAELIRVQIELEKVGYKTNSHAFCATTNPGCLKCREEKLLQGRPLARWTKRGVIEFARCEWDFWREYGDEVWETELPWRVSLMKFDGAGIECQGGGRYGVASKQLVHNDLIITPRPVAPDEHFFSDSVGDTHAAADILAARWPGIEFHVPIDWPIPNVRSPDI